MNGDTSINYLNSFEYSQLCYGSGMLKLMSNLGKMKKLNQVDAFNFGNIFIIWSLLNIPNICDPHNFHSVIFTCCYTLYIFQGFS
jgi:hypothetical protein